jgi:hypothetical protein
MNSDTPCPIHEAAMQARRLQKPDLLVNQGLLNSMTEECKSCALCKEAIRAIKHFAIMGDPKVFDALLNGTFPSVS